MTRPRLVGVLILVLFVGALVLSLSSVRAVVDASVSKWFSRQEVRFEIPNRPLPLDADVVIVGDGATICNRGGVPWKDAIVRVTSRQVIGRGQTYDLPLLGKIGTLSAGACADVTRKELFSPGWKKIPAPSQIVVVRVEILTRVTGQGYFAKNEIPPANQPAPSIR